MAKIILIGDKSKLLKAREEKKEFQTLLSEIADKSEEEITDKYGKESKEIIDLALTVAKIARYILKNAK